MSWWSDKEEPSKWYLEHSGDGNDYPEEEYDQDELIPDERPEEDIIHENLYLM